MILLDDLSIPQLFPNNRVGKLINRFYVLKEVVLPTY